MSDRIIRIGAGKVLNVFGYPPSVERYNENYSKGAAANDRPVTFLWYRRT